MVTDAIVSRWVIPECLLTPSMTTDTLITGPPMLRKTEVFTFHLSTVAANKPWLQQL